MADSAKSRREKFCNQRNDSLNLYKMTNFNNSKKSCKKSTQSDANTDESSTVLVKPNFANQSTIINKDREENPAVSRLIKNKCPIIPFFNKTNRLANTGDQQSSDIRSKTPDMMRIPKNLFNVSSNENKTYNRQSTSGFKVSKEGERSIKRCMSFNNERDKIYVNQRETYKPKGILKKYAISLDKDKKYKRVC